MEGEELLKFFRDKTLWWRVKVSLLHQPHRLQLVASFLFWCGIVGQFLAFLFEASSWVAFGFAVLAFLARALALYTDVFLASFWNMIASPFFFLGVLLLAVANGVAETPTSSGPILIAGLVLIILAMVFLFLYTRETLRLPIFGVQNNVFWAGLTFLSGSCLFLCAIALSLASGSTFIIFVLSAISYLLLNIGCLFFFLSSCVFANGSADMVLHRYPSTAIFKDNPTSAKIYFVCSVLALTASILTYCALVSSSSWVSFAGACALAVLSVLQALVFLPTRRVLYFFGVLLRSIHYGLAAASFSLSLPWQSPSWILLLASALTCVVSVLFLLLQHLHISRKSSFSLLSSGNQPLWSFALDLCGSSSLICAAFLSSVTTKCTIVWSFCITLSNVIWVLQASHRRDIAHALNFDKSEGSKWRQDFQLPPEMSVWSASEIETVIDETFEVIIVGGGPSGLTAANELGLRGVRVALFDPKSAVVPDSRFFLLNPATMEGLKRLGILESILELGQSSTAGWGSCFSSGLTHDDQEVFGNAPALSRDVHAELGNESSRLSASRSTTGVWASQPGHRCIQSVQESVLLQKAKSYDCVQVRFEHRVECIKRRNDGRYVVFVKQETTQEVKAYEAQYVIGCDGAMSRTSQLCRTKFDGFMHLAASRSIYIYSPNLFSLTQGKLCESHQYHLARKGVGAGYFALRDSKRGLWTFHLVVLFDGRSPTVVPPDEMYEIVREFIGPHAEFEVITDGRWRWNFAVARTFVKEKIALCGDAAHAWPPFLGNGGNTAYQDVQNLCWKIDACLKGWGGDLLFKSYDAERRENCLRGAIAVMSFTPSPSRIKIAAKFVLNKFLRPLIIARWLLISSGEHMGNIFAQQGVSYGFRYDFSPVIVGGNEISTPPEDPFPIYIPKIAAGGKALHVEFKNKQSLHDLIALSSYTIFCCRKSSKEIASKFEEAFRSFGAPIKNADIFEELENPRPGRRNEYAASLWKELSVVICRPDLCVALAVEASTEIRVEDARKLCAKILGREAEITEPTIIQWLSWRMVESMKPMQTLFPKAKLVTDVEKEYSKEALVTKAQEVEKDKGKEELIELNLLAKLCCVCARNVAEKDLCIVANEVMHSDCIVEFRKTSSIFGIGNEERKTITSRPGFCDHCEKLLSSDEQCFLNDHRLHTKCLAPFRKRIGVTEKVCAFCSKLLVGNVVMLRHFKVHQQCLESFQEFSEKFKEQEINF